MGKVFAFDIGVASVGWAVVDSENYDVVENGVNLFNSADASENVSRRLMRQSRRLKRRQRTRITDFNKLWMKNGLPIQEAVGNRIIELKVRALSEKISLNELYYVLLNSLKHRGISYLEDAENDGKSNGTEYAKGIAINQEELKNYFPCEIQLDRLRKYGEYRGQVVINEDDEKTVLYNVFTIGAYRKEIEKILETQSRFHDEITGEFCKNFIDIFNRKREYYIGPGNELSRTDYGIYTTKPDGNGGYITDKNIFEKLIGKCSVYEEELRASAASYTAQEFNVLNDLNNITVNGRKLEKDEKIKIVYEMQHASSVNVRKIIKKVIGEEIVTLDGARIDKKDKEIFHCFETYNKMRRFFDRKELAFSEITTECLDSIGDILTLNTERDAITGRLEELGLDEDITNAFIEFRKTNGSLFSKWHSFSIKIMKELIPEMYEQPKEQMQLLTEMGVFKKKEDVFDECDYIPTNCVAGDIYNPVVSRAVRISFRVINALIKKYGYPEKIVLEMPRDKNSDEEKERITKAQGKNEKELEGIKDKIRTEYGINISDKDFRNYKGLVLRLKLWNEQGGVCPYSGKPIEILDLLNRRDDFEIDHIIPLSVSFDDSRNNKVLVYRTENQDKKNRTPYMYLTGINREYGWEAYRNNAILLFKNNGISSKKLENMLYTKDITKIDVLKGFINRNINDTGYASRVVLNTLQSFFAAKDCDTKIYVIRGSFTHQMRVNLNLEKNREESYSHHSVDAMLIAYSQLGYDAFRKLQGTFIDFETGELLDSDKWENNMTKDKFKEYLYGHKWSTIRGNIDRAEPKTKYWYAVDRKCNRSLCKQTIYGTREINGDMVKINRTSDIRTKDGVKFFRNAIDNEQRDKFLMFHNDIRTFEFLEEIFRQYSDADNPFVAYEKETGDIIRKYSKKHNGPKITNLSYYDGKVNYCIDISHKYGHEKGSKKVILEGLNPYRMDVYYNNNDKLYYFVGIKQSHIKCVQGKYVIDEEAYSNTLVEEKMIKQGQDRMNLFELGYEFVLSFYKNDIIRYEKDGQMYEERFLSRTMDRRNYIETKPVYAAKFPKRNLVGLSKTGYVAKVRVDILGNRYICTKEEFENIC